MHQVVHLMLVSIGVHVCQNKAVGGGLDGALGVSFFALRPGAQRQIGVTGAIDEGLRFIKGQPLLVGDQYSLRLAVFRPDAAEIGLEQHDSAGFSHHLVVDALQLFRVDGNPVQPPRRNAGDAGPALHKDLSGKPPVDHFLFIGKGAPGGHKPHGPHAAQSSGRLDQQGALALSRTGDGRRAARRAAARYDHIILSPNGDVKRHRYVFLHKKSAFRMVFSLILARTDGKEKPPFLRFLQKSYCFSE